MQYPYQDYVGLIQQSLIDHWDMPALTDYKGITLQYKDVARKIEKLHLLFEAAGIQPEDKIAICGRNSAHWAVAFLATMTYGAIAVPILHEFKAEQVHNIVNHSDARLLFAGDVVWPTLKVEDMPNIEGVVHLPDFQLMLSRSEMLTAARENLNARFGERYPKYFRKEHVSYRPSPEGDALAIINYTSGTTSNSKGVLIPYRALWSNYDFALQVLGEQVKAGQRIISMLPMAHLYGRAFAVVFACLHGVPVPAVTRQR
ncbi:MAG: AMP-binding protein, partial [Bacteroidales bacterium]|nr:AMP-binding protein [Bacteroidales bacterium]